MTHLPTEGRDLRGDTGTAALAHTVRSAPGKHPVSCTTREQRRSNGGGPVSIQPSYQRVWCLGSAKANRRLPAPV